MHLARILIALGAALAAPVALAADAEPFKLLSVDDVAALVGKPGVALLDANTPETFAKGHLPGAVFVDEPLAARLPRDRSARLVFYCKNPK